jgi:hypothetical protein
MNADCEIKDILGQSFNADYADFIRVLFRNLCINIVSFTVGILVDSIREVRTRYV